MRNYCFAHRSRTHAAAAIPSLHDRWRLQLPGAQLRLPKHRQAYPLPAPRRPPQRLLQHPGDVRQGEASGGGWWRRTELSSGAGGARGTSGRWQCACRWLWRWRRKWRGSAAAGGACEDGRFLPVCGRSERVLDGALAGVPCAASASCIFLLDCGAAFALPLHDAGVPCSDGVGSDLCDGRIDNFGAHLPAGRGA